MFDVVLVGADDSATARRAVEAACEICAMSKGTLHIVTAFDQLSTVNATNTPEFKHVINEDDGKALLQTLSFIAKKHGVEPVLHGAKGDPADTLIAKADEVGADLIVVGNRGMKGVRRVLGSVPNSVAHGAACSVLIVDTTE
ncbi:MAG: universal stress protein [Acidimicrobiales bacterium]|jgi:nucleotide-binding universal stress UspA family protein